jgi:PKD repeat protein
MPRYRAIRRLGLAGALAAAALVAAQIVLAAPPSVTNLTITPDNTPEAGQSRTFTATAVDPDNDIARYEWDFDYDGTFTVDRSTTTGSTSFAYSTPGQRSVAVRVVDTAGDPAAGGDGSVDTSAPAVRPIDVAPPNQPPTAQVSCSPAQINQGDALNCTSSGSADPDGGIVSYEWRVDGGGFLTGGPTYSPNTTNLTPGNHTITLRVTDTDGATDTATSNAISVNAKPVADILAVAAAPPPPNLPADTQVNAQINQHPPTPTPLVGQRVAFDGSDSTDPGGSITSYAWDVDGDGFDDGTGNALVHVFPTPGTKTVRLRVLDAQNAEGIDQVTLRVNSLPTAGYITDDPTPVINQNVAFVSTSSDPDNDISSYAWDFDNDGQFGEAAQSPGIVCQNPQSPNASCRFDAAGTYTVKLRITDTGGISRTATRQLLIQASVPNAAFGFTPDAPVPAESVMFSSTSTATAGKQITGYEWDFSYDGTTFNREASGASVSHAFSSPGPKTVALKVTEAQPGGGPQTGGFDIFARTVTVNAPPQAGFHVAPENAFVGDSVTLSSTSFDSDGSLPRQEWDLDNDGQFDDANAAVVSARFGRPGTYPLKLRVTDSRGASSTASGRVIVQSRPVPPLQVLPGVEVEARFRLFARNTRVKFLRVRAPAGSKVSVRCLGKKNCPKRLTKMSKGPKKLQFKKLQRTFRPRTKLIITVTKGGFIGKQTTYTMRRRKPPIKRSLCLAPGAKKANACPSG